MSKGSNQRPSLVAKEVYELRYILAFGKPEEKEVAKKRLEALGIPIKSK